MICKQHSLLKAFPELAGCFSRDPLEYLGEVSRAVEAGFQGYIGDSQGPLLQQLLSGIHPTMDQILHGGLSNGIPETPQALPGTDGGGIGNLFQSDFFPIMIVNKSEHTQKPVLISRIVVVGIGLLDFL